MNTIAAIALLLFIAQQSLAAERSIIVNEDTLMGTCTGDCNIRGPINQNPEMLKDPYKCQTVKNCKLNSKGWDRGFVRCDYCQCTCVDNNPSKDVLVSKTNKWITEPDLYGTCRTKCPRGGLVRTNFKGCQEVRDCRHARNGWTRGFVRCDYCQCDCINRKYAASYVLKDVTYNMDQLDVELDQPTVVARTIIENQSGTSNLDASRTLSFTYSESVSVETTKSIEAGLSLTVHAGASVGPVNAGYSVTASLNTGFSTTSGEVESKQVTDSIQASASVPPGKSVELKVVGHSMKIDIPYTGTLVTTYNDGASKSETITGIFAGVETNQFRVQKNVL